MIPGRKEGLAPTDPKNISAEPLSPNAFAEAVLGRELPIDPMDAVNFARGILDQSPPDGFLQRIVNGLSFKSRPAFETDFAQFSQGVSRILQDRPYSVVYDEVESSGKWIYEQLVASGVHRAEAEFNEVRVWSLQDGIIPMEYIHLQLPPRSLVLAPDDLTVTTDQMGALARQTREYDNNVAVMYATVNAERQLSSPRLTRNFFTLPKRVPMLTQLLMQDDIAFIRNLYETFDLGYGDEIYGSEILFWTWYKVPDNIPYIFTDKSPFPLIRSDNFKQPYRNAEA